MKEKEGDGGGGLQASLPSIYLRLNMMYSTCVLSRILSKALSFLPEMSSLLGLSSF